MLLKLRSYFIPTHVAGQENTRKASLLIFGVIVVILASFVYLMVTVVMNLPRGMVIMSAIFTSNICLLLFFKNNILTYRTTANLFLAVCTTGVVFCVYYDGGIYSSILPWLTLTAVGAIIFLSKREAILWAIMVSILVVSFSFMNYMDISLTKDVPKSVYPVFISLTTLGLIVAFSFMVQYFEDTLLTSLNEINAQKLMIEREQKRSDELLLNILPQKIMDELKETGKTPAHSFEQVSVIFADFKDFSKISSTLTPEVLVEALEDYFEAFDRIIGEYDIEKIKTVGDAYICASGIPAANTDNAFIAVDVAHKILDVIAEYKIKRKDKVNFDIRIGIHTGPVVAGVVGITKFVYDIWGDTVNTAARMQENGGTNLINVSQSTYEIIKDKYQFEYRGKISAKNKGEIDMYFITGKQE